MERRSFFRKINNQAKVVTSLPPESGLDPYSGSWTSKEVAHLLKRTTFGPNIEQLRESLTLGLKGTVQMLLEDLPLPSPPLNYDFDGDPEVPLGSTWVNAGYDPINNTNGYRRRSMYAWTQGQLLTGEMNIREKMTLFWHNHFVVADLNDARFYYRYQTLLRTSCLGDFKQLTKNITIDPAMLRYLNGNQNSKNAPNENYARELLELFTIGKGPQAGPGDYTNYTEDDVSALAKVLTGWRDQGYNNTANPTVGSIFVLNRHDVSIKKLSHRFGNVTIANGGENEYKTLIDIIFQQREVARFICRKIYRWFVYYKIDSTIESSVIEPMAQLLIDNNYEIKPVMKTLLESQHFYDSCVMGCMIKHPLDFMSKIVNQYKISIETEVGVQYRRWITMSIYGESLQMRPFFHPNVAGWSPFYQEPSYYQIWLNSVTLPLRHNLSDSVCLPTVANNVRIDIDPIPFIESLSDPLIIDKILDDINVLLFSKPFTESQVTALKEVILPGLPDYEWTLEYQLYKDNPNDTQLKRALETKVFDLLKYIMRMPEFQLS